MDTVRFGIVGLGHMGRKHAEMIAHNVKNAFLTAVCDSSYSNVKLVTDKYDGVSAFTDVDAMLDSGLIDALVIATPHFFHPEIAIKAFNRGINVLTEKPAGVYTEQVKAMNDAADRSGKVFSIMFNKRAGAIYKRVKEIVESGILGKIKRVSWINTNWYRPQSYYEVSAWRGTWRGEGGGLMFNQCPHQIDLLQWILGEMPQSVHSFCHFGKWHNIEVEDDVTAYFEFPSGATGVFIASTGECPGSDRLEISGTGGKLICENGVIRLNALTETIDEYDKRWIIDTTSPQMSDEIIVESHDTPHCVILQNFVDAILGKAELYIDGREGLRSVEIMDAVLLSTWLCKTVTLPIDDELYKKELYKRIDG